MNNRRHDENGNLIFEDSRYAETAERTQIGFKYLVPMSVAMQHHVGRFVVESVKRVVEVRKEGPSFKLEIMARPA